MPQSRLVKLRRFRSQFARAAQSTSRIEHAADPLDKLARRERLCHIFVRAKREPFLPLYVATFGGEHNDPHTPPSWIATYLLADGVAVATRDHDVEEHEVWRLLSDGSKRRLAIRDRAHTKASLLQQKLKREHDIGLVIGNEDRRTHDPASCFRGPRITVLLVSEE